MAVTTHIMPVFVVPSGELVVKFITSYGAGGDVTYTEKYLSGISPIVKETEYNVGLLKHDTVSFEVAYDKDNIFHDVIFSDIYTIGNWIDVEILFTPTGSVQKKVFQGNINKFSVVGDYVYSDGYNHSTPMRSYSFLAVWFIQKMENISIQTLKTRIQGSTDYYDEHDGINNFSNIRQIVRCILDEFESLFPLYSNKIELTFNFDLLFASKDAYYDPLNAMVLIAGVGDVTTRQFPDGVGLITSGTVDVFRNRDSADGIFFQFENCYELFKSILISFNIVCEVTYPTTDTYLVELKGRASGSQVNINDNLTITKDFALEGVDTVNISSTVLTDGGSTFKDKSDSIKNKSYSDSVAFGCMRSTDPTPAGNEFQQGAELVLFGEKYVYSYFPTRERRNLFLAQNIYFGNNLILNPSFEEGVDGWTTQNFYLQSDGGKDGDYYLRCDLDTTTYATKYIEYAFTETQHSVFAYFWMKASLLPLTEVDILISMYDADGNVIGNTAKPTITYTSAFQGEWRLVTTNLTLKYLDVAVAKIRVTVTPNISDAGSYISLDSFGVFRGYSGTTELIGRNALMNYGYQSSKLKVNSKGIYLVKIADFIGSVGKNYYIKKISTDYVNDETEIEAINYSS